MHLRMQPPFRFIQADAAGEHEVRPLQQFVFGRA